MSDGDARRPGVMNGTGRQSYSGRLPSVVVA